MKDLRRDGGLTHLARLTPDPTPMEIARTAPELTALTARWRREGLAWAFVPTMGALHDGHLALCRAAARDYPRVLASVFVNPTQFDRADDLARYPRQPAHDAEVLRAAGVHALFLPEVGEVYPDGPASRRPTPDLAGLDARYEGALRPGHFAGVVQVVRRLVELVRPAAVFMGQKDAQQVAVLRRAAAQEFWPVEIVTVPIVREASGLAMSSRNRRLSPAGLAAAATINACLDAAERGWGAGTPPADLQAAAKTRLRAAGLAPEYFDFVHADTFEPLGVGEPLAPGGGALIVVAARVEGVRLIDNRPLPARG